MVRLPSILCDEAELAVEAAQLADELRLGVAPRVSARPIEEALEAVACGERVALALVSTPTADELVTLADAARIREKPLPIALLGRTREAALHRHLGSDLGLITVRDVRPLLAA